MTQPQSNYPNYPNFSLEPKLSYRTLAILIVSTLLWGLLLIPSRDLATLSAGQITLWDAAIQPPLMSLIENTYHLIVSTAPFTIILGLSGAWAFYFIRAPLPAMIFCALPLISFMPLALHQVVTFL